MILVIAVSLFAWLELPLVKFASVAKSFTKADVDRALSDASRLRHEGRYEDALERHIWYHKNAMRYAPEHYGVRLSFALAYWAELGGVFPKAKDALRSVRDETLAAYRKKPSDWLVFGEVMSLNMYLDDLESAMALFYEGRKNRVEETGLLLYLDRILATGDKKWARDVIGDPRARLALIEDQVFMRNRFMRRDETPGDMKGMLDESDARQVAILLKAVGSIDGLSAAQALQNEALKFLDSPIIREALYP